MNTQTTAASSFPMRAFLLTALLAGIWINLSEVVRYFALIMPMVKAALPGVENVAPISPGIFFSWMVWDTVLVLGHVLIVWLYLEKFGYHFANALKAATLVWFVVFVLFWLGSFNLALATPALLAVALPLAWIEMAVGALIVQWGMRYFA